MSIKQVVIDSTTYNIPQIPAVQQDELLHMVTNTSLALVASGSVPDSEQFWVGVFANMSFDDVSKIASMVMGKVCISGASTPVTIDDFTGRLVSYRKLVGEAVRAQLEDFFGLLGDAHNERETLRAAMSSKSKV